MNVLFVTRKYPPQKGGMEKYSEQLFKNFPENNTTIKLTKPNYHLIWFYPYALIKTLITAHKFDIIHFGDGVLGYMAYITLKFTKKPVAITIHGKEITYKNILHQGINIEPLLKTDITIFTVSSFSKKLCAKRGFKKTKTLVIPNCIEQPKKIKSQNKNIKKINQAFDLKLKKEDFIITSISRLIKRKGIYWFAKNALPQLPKNTKYIIAGTGPEEEPLKNIHSHQIVLLGKISEKQKKILLENSDIYLMPNIKVKDDAEGFGIAAIEAAAHRLPVIGPRIEGLADVINSEIGTSVKTKDKKSYTEAINSYINNPELLEKKSQNAHNYTVDNFSCQNMAEKYAFKFQKIIDDHRKSS